jgi:hypothetical protein
MRTAFCNFEPWPPAKKINNITIGQSYIFELELGVVDVLVDLRFHEQVTFLKRELVPIYFLDKALLIILSKVFAWTNQASKNYRYTYWVTTIFKSSSEQPKTLNIVHKGRKFYIYPRNTDKFMFSHSQSISMHKWTILVLDPTYPIPERGLHFPFNSIGLILHNSLLSLGFSRVVETPFWFIYAMIAMNIPWR